VYLYLVDAEVAGGPRRRPTPAGENTSRASNPARLASTRAVERRRQGALLLPLLLLLLPHQAPVTVSQFADPHFPPPQQLANPRAAETPPASSSASTASRSMEERKRRGIGGSRHL